MKEKTQHTLEVNGEIQVRKGGVFNVGSETNVNIKSKGFIIGGLFNLGKQLSDSFWKIVVAGVIVGVIVLILEKLFF